MRRRRLGANDRDSRFLHLDGRSMHQTIIDQQRRWRSRGEPSPGFRWRPGTIFTDGTHLFEVVYGCQCLGRRAGGWVVGLRTDYFDAEGNLTEAAGRYYWTLFTWSGRPRNGCILLRGSAILWMVKPAPSLCI